MGRPPMIQRCMPMPHYGDERNFESQSHFCALEQLEMHGWYARVTALFMCQILKRKRRPRTENDAVNAVVEILKGMDTNMPDFWIDQYTMKSTTHRRSRRPHRHPTRRPSTIRTGRRMKTVINRPNHRREIGFGRRGTLGAGALEFQVVLAQLFPLFSTEGRDQI